MIPHDAWPVDPGVVAPFFLAVLLVELTPGPNMGWLALVTLRQGITTALAAVGGVTVGLTIYMLAAALGLAELFVRFRSAYEALRWAGVLYLLWLAYEAAFSSTPTDPDAPVGLANRERWSAFRRGLIANLLNPKAAVFYVTLLPTFMKAGHASPFGQALTLGAVHILVSMAVHCGIVVGAARLRLPGASLSDRSKTRMRWASGAGIAAIAIWLAVQSR